MYKYIYYFIYLFIYGIFPYPGFQTCQFIISGVKWDDNSNELIGPFTLSIYGSLYPYIEPRTILSSLAIENEYSAQSDKKVLPFAFNPFFHTVSYDVIFSGNVTLVRNFIFEDINKNRKKYTFTRKLLGKNISSV